jgi:glycosyltransferase involved in cell wall biosynthesis
MKRILFLDHTAKLSGGERSLLLILEKLNRKRYIPFLVTLEEGPLLESARALGVETDCIPIPLMVSERKRSKTGMLFLFLSLLMLLPTVIAIARYARNKEIDVIYTNSQKAHLVGLVAGKVAGAPVFWHFRDILDEQLLQRLMCYMGVLFGERIIAISNAVAAQFRICGRESKKVLVVYNAIDMEDFERKSREKAADLRAEFGIPRKARIVASIGQIAEWKGQEYLLRAAKELIKRYEDVHFFIIGKPLFKEQGYQEHLLRQVHELGLEGRIHFTGFRWDIPAIMRDIDILVHTPVKPEPFGRVLIEAMVCDTAVIAFDMGAVREIITNETGICVHPGDVNSLMRAITTLLDDNRQREEMVKKARNGARARFDYPALIRKIEHLFQA